MQLYNTLTRKKEDLKPVNKNELGIYSCGPTVYWNQHIGHMYAYIQYDTMVRFFRYLGLDVKWVMNITDVGHLTSDEDTGEDKMEKGAKREDISVWDLADKYIKQFTESMELLNISRPDHLVRATDHIQEQIDLNKKIEENGYTYKTEKGLVFDTSKFGDYAKFGNLKLDNQEKREDVEDDPNKKAPWDFFLWAKDSEHIMKWESPWGTGFPGWHIECTAMSTTYLGESFDIHTGGYEHIAVHHTNEIAQGYGAFGHQTANYWLHNSWLTFKGEKMSKSLGNIFTVQDLLEKGYDPMHFRYLVLTSHYRKGISFSFEALDSAKVAYEKLLDFLRAWKSGSRESLSEEKLKKLDDFRNEFKDFVSDDLNFPKALSALWKVAKSNIPNKDKLDLVLDFDQVLGLRLNENSQKIDIPYDVVKLAEKREQLRKEGKYEESDEVREEIARKGFNVKDTKSGFALKIVKK